MLLDLIKNTTLVYLIVLNFANAQTSLLEQNRLEYEAYDSFLPHKNKDIFNGFEYVDLYRSRYEYNHKFYGVSYFLSGDLLYEGRPFFSLKMKYNILDDLLLLNYLSFESNYLCLLSERVDEFTIDKAKFIRLPRNKDLEPFYLNGFFKVIYSNESDLAVYVKYQKKKYNIVEDRRIYYGFSEKKTFVLSYKENYFTINSKKDIIKLFLDYKNTIRDFYGKNNVLFKHDEDEFYKNLFIRIDKLNSE